MPEFIYFVRPVRDTLPRDATEAEMAVMRERMAFLHRKLAEGSLDR